MLLYYSFLFCVVALALAGAYLLTIRLYPSLSLRLRPSTSSSSSYLPLPTSFADQVRAGFSSSLFDVAAHNLDPEAGDARAGLDEAGLDEVRRIMSREGKTFDEARLARQQRLFGKNNIDPLTGMPLDSKAVTRL